MIVVTGGAGFIGSNIVAALDEQDRDVVVCDRLRDNEKWRNLSKRVLRAVISPPGLGAFLQQHAADIRGIVHMGAISSTTATDGDLVIQTNFELSRSLWDWCAHNEVPFVYASSAATYGNGEHGFDDDAHSRALRRLRPLNLYGWSKHLFDQHVSRALDRGEPRPPQHAGLKFFNVYGPNEYHKGSMQSVVAHLFPRVSQGEPARLFRSYHPDYVDGGQLRDFVYVRDCAEIVRWLLDNPEVSGLFNLGTGEARSFSDLAHATMRALDLEPEIEFVDMPEGLRDKYQYFTQATMTRLRDAGYNQPITSLEEGVADYVQRYLDTDDAYR